jgi:RND family efflux transporter MFP subunit
MRGIRLARSKWWLEQSRKAVPIVSALGGIAGVVLLLLLLAGVFQAKVSEETLQQERGMLVAELPLGEVRVVVRPRFESAVGTVKPVHESRLASKLLARVVEVNVTAGQAVTAGDVLVRLEDADLQSRRGQSESAEAAAAARKQQAEADYQRAQELIAKQAISAADYDRALAAKNAASSDADRAREAVREATVVLEYATVRAPLTGIVVDKQVEPGDTVTPGQVLLTLYDPRRMQMVASVRESLAQQLSVGQQLPARIDALDYECRATVSEIVPQAESASRSFEVKVTGSCPPGIYSGMFGRLLLPLGEEQVVTAPLAAVRYVGQLAVVDVVQRDTTLRRHVQLGRKFADGVEVLAGLRPGEKVVLRDREAAR